MLPRTSTLDTVWLKNQVAIWPHHRLQALRANVQLSNRAHGQTQMTKGINGPAAR